MWKRPVRVTSKAYLRSYFLRLFHPLHLSRPILNRSVCSRWFCVFYPKFVHLEVCVCRHEWLYIGWGWFCIFSEARGRSWRLNLQFRRPRCSQTVSRPSMVQSLMQALCTQPPPPPFLSLQCFSHAPLILRMVRPGPRITSGMHPRNQLRIFSKINLFCQVFMKLCMFDLKYTKQKKT